MLGIAKDYTEAPVRRQKRQRLVKVELFGDRRLVCRLVRRLVRQLVCRPVPRLTRAWLDPTASDPFCCESTRCSRHLQCL